MHVCDMYMCMYIYIQIQVHAHITCIYLFNQLRTHNHDMHVLHVCRNSPTQSRTSYPLNRRFNLCHHHLHEAIDLALQDAHVPGVITGIRWLRALLLEGLHGHIPPGLLEARWDGQGLLLMGVFKVKPRSWCVLPTPHNGELTNIYIHMYTCPLNQPYMYTHIQST